MKILREGHYYKLDSLEGTNPQELRFIEKEKVGDEFITVHDGTTNEEVLKVLINRLNILGHKLPSRESSIAITKLEECLMWLERRTADRIARQVENTPLP